MNNPIQRLHFLLDSFKGFDAAHTSENNKEMLVKIDDKVYKLTITDTGEKDLTIDTLKRHLK